MFATKKTIILLTQTKLSLLEVVLSKTPTVTTKANYNWTPATLLNVFQTIQKQLHRPFRLLLSEDFVYVLTLALPPEHLTQRETVKRLAQEQIPDTLDATAWDYKEVLENKKPSQSASMAIVQVVAVQKRLYDNLKLVFEKLHIRAENIEPFSIALARLVSHEEKPLLLIYNDQFPLLVMAKQGLVVATESMYQPLTLTSIDTFIGFVKERFSITPEKILLCGETKQFNMNVFTTKKQPVQVISLHPAIGIAQKENLKKDNMQTLTLQIPSLTSSPHLPQLSEETPEIDEQSSDEISPPIRKKGQKKKLILIIFLVLLNIFMLGAAGIYFFYSTQAKEQPVPTSAKEDQSPSTTPSPPKETTTATESATVAITDYPLTVLNGSGIPGKATELAASLTTQGFVVTTIANASSSAYQATQIYYNASVPKTVKFILDKFLQTFYRITTAKQLQEETSTPITIIVGQE